MECCCCCCYCTKLLHFLPAAPIVDTSAERLSLALSLSLLGEWHCRCRWSSPASLVDHELRSSKRPAVVAAALYSLSLIPHPVMVMVHAPWGHAMYLHVLMYHMHHWWWAASPAILSIFRQSDAYIGMNIRRARACTSTQEQRARTAL